MALICTADIFRDSEYFCRRLGIMVLGMGQRFAFDAPTSDGTQELLNQIVALGPDLKSHFLFPYWKSFC